MTVMRHPTCKIALVGDVGAGKTSFLSVFHDDQPVKNYSWIGTHQTFVYSCLIPLDCPISVDPKEPTSAEWILWREGWNASSLPRKKRDQDVIMTLVPWDTASEEDFERLRPLVYLNASVIALCIAIDNLKALDSVVQKWLPEFKHMAPTVPVVIVGCKLDLRDEVQPSCLILPEQGAAIAEQIGADGYIECSARTTQNVERVIQFLAWVGTHHVLAKKERKGCIIA